MLFIICLIAASFILTALCVVGYDEGIIEGIGAAMIALCFSIVVGTVLLLLTIAFDVSFGTHLLPELFGVKS